MDVFSRKAFIKKFRDVTQTNALKVCDGEIEASCFYEKVISLIR